MDNTMKPTRPKGRRGETALDDRHDVVAPVPSDWSTLYRALRHRVERQRASAPTAQKSSRQEQTRSDSDKKPRALTHAVNQATLSELEAIVTSIQQLVYLYHGKGDGPLYRPLWATASETVSLRDRVQTLLSVLNRTAESEAGYTCHIEELVGDLLRSRRRAILRTRALIQVEFLPIVQDTPLRLFLLFAALLDNALKFQGPDRPQIRIACQDRDSEYVFSVRDNGIGIPSGQTDQIFDLFHRAHQDGHYIGAGVGLAICRCIVAGHGGRVWAESENGDGTTVFFTLPHEREKEADS